jgi:hypothetical protein
VVGHERLELGDRVEGGASTERCLGVPLAGGDPQLLQPDGRGDQPLGGHVHERRPPPQGQPGGEPVAGLARPAGGQRRVPVRCEPLEPAEVERLRPDAHPVPGADRLDGVPAQLLA